MCPRPLNAKKIPIGVEFENLVAPTIFNEAEAEKRNKSACFYIGDDDDDEDYPTAEEVRFGAESELDNTSEAHFDAHTFDANNSWQNDRNQSPLESQPIIEPKQLQVCHQAPVMNGKEHENRELPSALKKPVSFKNGSEKSVRFADSVGLSLTQVRLFEKNLEFYTEYLDMDYLMPAPTTRMNIFENWKGAASVKSAQRQLSLRVPLMRSEEEVVTLVEAQNVCIESITCKGMTVSGIVQVKNMAYEKQVQVRYTLNNWATYSEKQCTFVASEADSRDSFSFSLSLPDNLPIGSCCEMYVRLSAAEQSFWDNNKGVNYQIDCCTITSDQEDNVSTCSTAQSCGCASAFMGVL